MELLPMKLGFGEALLDMGKAFDNLVCLGADITKSVGLDLFRDHFRDRFFSLGIAEQNIASVAAGLSLSGKIPVFSTYAVFSALRSSDQIRVSLCYNNTKVIIGGAHAGISVGQDGATHQALEDIAIMRALPNMTVLSPCDSNQTYVATKNAIMNLDKPCYIRYCREPLPNFTNKNQDFEIGKAQIISEGKDIGIVATGSMVWQSILAKEKLEEMGYSVRLLNIHTIKPIDEQAIIETAKITKAIISVEEHQIYGGLGSAVAEVISQNYPVKLRIIGMPDCFGESGSPEELLQKFGLNADNIITKALELLK
jgi:transketolase